MNPSHPRLKLKLPTLAAEHYYQLIFIGKRWLPTADHVAGQVTLYFHLKKLSDNFQQPVGRWISRRINLAETLALIVGSLWDDAGQMVSDGRFLLISDTQSGEAREVSVFSELRSFTLGPAPPRLAQLSELLDISRLKSKFLRQQGSSWALTHTVANVTYIIPCAEILRSFYYVDGVRLVDFFSARVPLHQVCRLITPPGASNDFTVHIAVVTDGFTPHQLCVLAELCLNKPFLRAAIQAHSLLVSQVFDAPRTAVNLALAFASERAVRITANGFSFTHQQTTYFWVCAIQHHEGLWGFHSLTCEWDTDHRSAAVPEDHAVTSSTGSVTINVSPSPTVPLVLNSDQAGDQQGPDLELALPLLTVLPDVVIAPKLNQEGRSLTQKYFSVDIPTFLTQRSGKGPGGVKPRTIRTATPPIDLPDFFRQVLQQIVSQDNRWVLRVIELNNRKGSWGHQIAVFPYWWKDALPAFTTNGEPRRLGIAEFRYGNRYFYFLQLLEHKRAAMLYRQDLQGLSDNQLNQVLKHYAQANLDWVKLAAAEKPQSGKTSELTRSLDGSALIVKARNHLNKQGRAAEITARLCLATMESIS